MSHPNPRRSSYEKYQSRLNESLPVSIMLWKTLKAFVQAFLLAAVGYVAVRYGADPTPVTYAVIAGIIAVFVGELKEAEIAGLVTLTFRGKEDD